MKTIHQYLIVALLLVGMTSGLGQPTITRHPTGASVSLGATVRLQASATSTISPVQYQWQFTATNLAGETNSTLTLTNIQAAQAGDYTFVATDVFGSTTSKVAVLEVDPTFTKITSSPVVKDTADGEGAAWVDFDNDGDLDLSVVSSDTPVHLLYRNDGTSGFTQIRDGVLSRDATGAETAAWADFDNDGLLDVFVSKASGYLFRQNPVGTFTRSTLGAPTVDWGVAAAEFNNDGFVDLVVRSSDPRKSVWLNDGLGGFIASTNSVVATGATSSIAAADFDDDGDADFFVSNNASNSRLYRNDGQGVFTPVTSGPGANGTGVAWGDYNNDGFPDLFHSRLDGAFQQPRPSFLFHNNGNGTFTQVEQSPFTKAIGFAVGCSWGDYDNDGWLDLFVAEYGPEKNRLFHNNGDGTFSRIIAGSVANDLGSSTAGVWGDYDRDGFLDLFVANGVGGNGGGDSTDYLYHNNGNANAWITIKCVGTASNRSAIGTKVRLRATIKGKTFWQLREISTGGSWVQNPLEAHFGLGEATNVETLRIEWPSGIVQEIPNVPAKQLLTVIEPPRLQITPPQTGSPLKLTLRGGIGFSYALEISADLRTWLPLLTNSATGLTLEFEDSDAVNFSRRFYRARRQP
ncbi:MAG: VCBS repeat-containing protein [Verrucomicrobia bacterium]|nr:VCBS repeat-containing protein [Verrucomicrobiota bacterium]